MNRKAHLALSRRQERDGMRRFGGKQQPRSGARWDRKNDGRTAAELVEFKRTSSRTITLKATDLRDLDNHAVTEGRYGVLAFELDGKRYVVLNERDYFDRCTTGSSLPVPGVPAETDVVPKGEVLGSVFTLKQQPVLRGISEQRTGPASQGSLPRHPSRVSGRVPGKAPVSRIRPGAEREVRRLGGLQRKRTPPDQEDS